MSYETGALNATLAAVAGDDAQLYAELRDAFLDSLARQVDLLGRARCDGNWRVAAQRLKGLAGSFQAWPLLVLADEALDAAPGDPVVLRKLHAYATSLTDESFG
jgi:hypothetical protein